MTDTIMLEAPARGGRISDLADGQGRILRLHDITASSLGHTSHANPDRKPINVANQTESPTRTGGRVTIERKPDEGDGPAVIHRLNDIKRRIDAGESDFATMARLHSVDNSATRGGVCWSPSEATFPPTCTSPKAWPSCCSRRAAFWPLRTAPSSVAG